MFEQTNNWITEIHSCEMLLFSFVLGFHSGRLQAFTSLWLWFSCPPFPPFVLIRNELLLKLWYNISNCQMKVLKSFRLYQGVQILVECFTGVLMDKNPVFENFHEIIPWSILQRFFEKDYAKTAEAWKEPVGHFVFE